MWKKHVESTYILITHQVADFNNIGCDTVFKNFDCSELQFRSQHCLSERSFMPRLGRCPVPKVKVPKTDVKSQFLLGKKKEEKEVEVEVWARKMKMKMKMKIRTEGQEHCGRGV